MTLKLSVCGPVDYSRVPADLFPSLAELAVKDAQSAQQQRNFAPLLTRTPTIDKEKEKEREKERERERERRRRERELKERERTKSGQTPPLTGAACHGGEADRPSAALLRCSNAASLAGCTLLRSS